MQALLFESPWLLAPTLLVAQLALVGIWSSRRPPLPRRIILGGFLTCPLLLLVQAWVQTDRERLIDICRQMARRVEAVDPPGFVEFLAQDFHSSGRSADGPLDARDMLDELRQLLNTYRIEQPRLRRFHVLVTGDQANVRYAATCRVITPDQVWPLINSAWELDFVRQDGQWRVVTLDMRPTPTLPFTSLAEIPR